MSEKVLYFQCVSELSFYAVLSFVTLLYNFCSPNVPQVLNEQAIAAEKLWLDNPGAVTITDCKSFRSIQTERGDPNNGTASYFLYKNLHESLCIFVFSLLRCYNSSFSLISFSENTKRKYEKPYIITDKALLHARYTEIASRPTW